jgi:hypothetical protein
MASTQNRLAFVMVHIVFYIGTRETFRGFGEEEPGWILKIEWFW